jgi:hypothetical protein
MSALFGCEQDPAIAVIPPKSIDLETLGTLIGHGGRDFGLPTDGSYGQERRPGQEGGLAEGRDHRKPKARPSVGRRFSIRRDGHDLGDVPPRSRSVEEIVGEHHGDAITAREYREREAGVAGIDHQHRLLSIAERCRRGADDRGRESLDCSYTRPVPGPVPSHGAVKFFTEPSAEMALHSARERSDDLGRYRREYRQHVESVVQVFAKSHGESSRFGVSEMARPRPTVPTGSALTGWVHLRQ